MRPQALLTVALTGTLSLFGLQGCTTESFCFDQCEGQNINAQGGEGGTGGAQGGTAGGLQGGFGGQGGSLIITGGASQGGSTGGTGVLEEIPCDGIDNDGNGETDENNDYTSLRSCGTCDNNCLEGFGLGYEISCDPPDTLDGTVEGTCSQTCQAGVYDVDGDTENGCEYACPFNPDGTNTTDPGGNNCGKDDDCDGEIDEDVDTCGDVSNCGRCGKQCVVLNGTAQCVTTAQQGEACTEDNTKCEVDQCDPGFFDVDGSADNGCEYQCPVTTPGPEVCDGIDNDCDGKIDNADSSLATDDALVGVDCYGGESAIGAGDARGECAEDTHKGVAKCVGAQIKCCDVGSNDIMATNPNFPSTGLRNGKCEDTDPLSVLPQVLEPGEDSEKCNNLDDDCDGLVDDSPIDAGGTCGQSVGSCEPGTEQCVNGALECVGAVDPVPDLCNGQDDNCDGVIDGVVADPVVPCTSDAMCNTAAGESCRQLSSGTGSVCAREPTDVGGPCSEPPAPPAGATSPCRAGTLICAGIPTCSGAVTAQTTTDACGEDSNCDGSLDNQPDLMNDVRNCGSCGNDCFANNPGNGLWACNMGSCEFQGCRGGFIDCGGTANDCEQACSGSSGNPELCNGVDDDCDCSVDEDIQNTPTPVQVCNVSPAATDPNCTTNVNVQCSSGSWQCTFPAGFCDNSAAPLYCSNSADDSCNNEDNNCNGTIDDNFQLAVTGPAGNYLGKDCFSDDGPGPSHGVCRTQGVYVCNGAGTATQCNATKNNALATDETCDGNDNDCDGDIDETYSSPGSDPRYVAPAVMQLPSGTWIYQYEASRPGADAVDPGTGNGWHNDPPTGVLPDNTLACSVQGVVPWFNLTAPEVAQTCEAVGGRICELSDWQDACEGPSGNCDYGYAPASACQSTGNYPQGNPHCNIGLYDYDTSAAGIQDGLLPTGYSSGSNPPALTNCRADWSGSNDVFDILGNLREATWNRTGASNNCDPSDPTDTDCLFTLMGGAFNTQTESGASCDFTFYTVDKDFKLFDVGFRCCFDTDPR